MKKVIYQKLNELQATAICGNDISSSCLYFSALTIMYAGQYAWVSLLVVAVVLFLFRKIYGEVVGALPLNGGAYIVLLNASNKLLATFAATLTVLSYRATAVISSIEGMHYLQGISLDRAYPEIHIECIEIDGVFGPDLIDELSTKWNIPKNFMFIDSLGDRFCYRVAELGGVRLIM